jgi:hypothetical protein
MAVLAKNMVMSDGDLVSSGGPLHVIRRKYQYTFRRIRTTHEIRATLRNGPYAWPGGYPLYLITSDGAALHFDCARANYRSISWSIRNQCRDGWLVEACDINYENPELYCDHCSEPIESAYGDTDD